MLFQLQILCSDVEILMADSEDSQMQRVTELMFSLPLGLSLLQEDWMTSIKTPLDSGSVKDKPLREDLMEDRRNSLMSAIPGGYILHLG